MVALVHRHDEHRVALVDAAGGEVLEEGDEGIVVRFELGLEIGFARPVGVALVRVGGWVRHVDIVGVRNIAVCHRHPGALHLLDITEDSSSPASHRSPGSRNCDQDR